MKLNLKNPCIQLKRPIKINKYHLKVGKKCTQKYLRMSYIKVKKQ